MKIAVHDFGRENNRISHLLVVTSEAKYCHAHLEERGYAISFGGSVWPSKLPEVFEGRNPPKVRDEILEHFNGSVATIHLYRQVSE